MDRRLGGPLPHQLANPTRVHLIPPEFFTPCHATLCAYAVLPAVSSCYPPCMRQVTHALLTRPPLSHKRLQSEEICRKCFVRLACVKHAASVHPEPGSNSHKNVFLSETHARLLAQLAKSLKTRVLNLVSFELTSFNSFLILCLRIHSIA